MDKYTQNSVWDSAGEISLARMNARIKCAVLNLGWQESVRIILRKGIDINNLCLAEAGCGTGTMALTFGLMGASVSLIDFNRKALERAGSVFRMYDCQAQYINEDCLNSPSQKLRGKFDLVISSGLLEHFSGRYTEAILNYHKELLKEGGFVLIGVPNARSPWYNFIRFIRTITATWVIDLEVPFSAEELKKRAEEIGLSDCYVIAYSGWFADFKYHIWGFFSALGDLLPQGIKRPLQEWKKLLVARSNDQAASSVEQMRRFCQDRVAAIKAGGVRNRRGFIDGLSSGLVLLAFNSPSLRRNGL